MLERQFFFREIFNGILGINGLDDSDIKEVYRGDGDTATGTNGGEQGQGGVDSVSEEEWLSEGTRQIERQLTEEKGYLPLTEKEASDLSDILGDPFLRKVYEACKNDKPKT